MTESQFFALGENFGTWSPVYQLLVIIFASFCLSEDITLFATAGLYLTGNLNLNVFWGGNFFGIVGGDTLLYLLGVYSQRFSWPWFNYLKKKLRKFQHNSPSGNTVQTLAIFCSRVLPGSRIPLYMTAGISGYPLWQFLLCLSTSTLLWLYMITVFGETLMSYFNKKTTLIVFLCIVLTLFVSRKIIKRREVLFSRLYWRTKMASLPKVWRASFWADWVFFTPVVIYVICLMLWYRHLFYLLYVNPGINISNFFSETKWSIHKSFSEKNHFLPYFYLPYKKQQDSKERFEYFKQLLSQKNLRFPLILKPNLGFKGYGLKRVSSMEEAREHLEHIQCPFALQTYSFFPEEVGIFYYRYPNEEKGRILSITKKEAASVTGDGRNSLADLILKNEKLSTNAGFYFKRAPMSLGSVVPQGEKVILSPPGNHCQGALFYKANHLWTPALEEKIDTISKSISGFFAGRFDIKYPSDEELKKGQNMDIIELNSFLAMDTNAYDNRNNPLQSYSILFRQYHILFKIGKKNYMKSKRKINLSSFLRDITLGFNYYKKLQNHLKINKQP